MKTFIVDDKKVDLILDKYISLRDELSEFKKDDSLNSSIDYTLLKARYEILRESLESFGFSFSEVDDYSCIQHDTYFEDDDTFKMKPLDSDINEILQDNIMDVLA